MLKIYFDGGTKGNRVCVARQGVSKITVLHAKQTNNQLEFSALIFALRSMAKHHTIDHNFVVNVVGDSELVIGAMNNEKIVRSPKLVDLYEQAIEELTSINNIDLFFHWVPRDENVAGLELDKK